MHIAGLGQTNLIFKPQTHRPPEENAVFWRTSEPQAIGQTLVLQGGLKLNVYRLLSPLDCYKEAV